MIFNIKTQKRDKYKDKFMGCYISTPVIEFLNLYKLFYRTTSSALIRSAVIEWIDKNDENLTSLFNKIVETIQIHWNSEKLQNTDFNEFITELKEELNKNSLSDEQINKIVAKINK